MVIWRTGSDPTAQPSDVQLCRSSDLNCSNPLWSTKVSPQDKVAVLSIQTDLDPNKVYEIQTLQDKKPVEQFRFKVMSEPQRREISDQLEQVRQQWKNEPANSTKLVQSQVEVFVQHELWSDALQFLNSSTLSPDQKQRTIEIVQSWKMNEAQKPRR